MVRLSTNHLSQTPQKHKSLVVNEPCIILKKLWMVDESSLYKLKISWEWLFAMWIFLSVEWKCFKLWNATYGPTRNGSENHTGSYEQNQTLENKQFITWAENILRTKPFVPQS